MFVLTARQLPAKCCGTCSSSYLHAAADMNAGRLWLLGVCIRLELAEITSGILLKLADLSAAADTMRATTSAMLQGWT
jgi:hypothetical protein